MINAIPVLLSAEGLSTDCSQPEKGRKVPISKMDVELALARLRAFASLSSMQLVEADAKIMIVRGDLRLTVINAGGRLMVAEGKSAEAEFIEKTAEEIVTWLMSVEAAKPKTGRTPANAKGGGSGRGIGSLAGEGKKIAAIVVMFIGICIMAWVNFGPEKPPEGIQFIDHPLRVAGLNKDFGGRYGDLQDPSQVAFIVEGEQLRVHLITPTGMEPDPLRVMAYRYGSFGTDEVLVAENGAILERDETGNLVHVGTIYPRIRK